MERRIVRCRRPSKMRRRSRIGICLQLVRSKFWSFLHDSITAKMPSAEMVVRAELGHDKLNCDRTGELSRSNFEGFQLLATPNVWSSVIADTGVVEDQDLERRG